MASKFRRNRKSDYICNGGMLGAQQQQNTYT